MEFHEYAHLFPLMSRDDARDLAADIKKNGLLHPITTFQGQVIDGRNRYAACQAAGVEPIFQELASGIDPLAYVVSTNYSRRHLSESQRALAAARIISHDVERDEAKTTFRVSTASIKNAESVLARGIGDLVHAVDHDHIPVALAAKLSAMPDEVQQEAVGLKVSELRGLVKRSARIKKVVKLKKATEKATAELGKNVYSVIYADPPWKFEPWSDKTGMDRSAENHYPVMNTQSISEMEIPAADNAVLFLWSTSPMLLDALDVMKRWGFSYRSQFVWVKDKVATGYWNRNRHETLLVGTRGNFPSPEPADRADSVFEEPTGGHSVKPAAVRDMIAKAYPALAKIELFAKERAAGWDSHGNELDDVDAEAEIEQAAD